MLASKAGSAKVSLKLVFKDDLPAGGLLFVFSNPAAAQREEERKIVQNILIPFVSANKTGTASTTEATGSAAAATPPAGSTPGTPSAVALGKRKAIDESAAPSPAPSGGAGAGTQPNKARIEAIKLRQRVLKKNPKLAALHRELVIGKQITEADFWQGREVRFSHIVKNHTDNRTC